MTGIQIRPGKEKTRGGWMGEKREWQLISVGRMGDILLFNGVAKFNVKSEPRPRWEESAVR